MIINNKIIVDKYESVNKLKKSKFFKPKKYLYWQRINFTFWTKIFFYKKQLQKKYYTKIMF